MSGYYDSCIFTGLVEAEIGAHLVERGWRKSEIYGVSLPFSVQRTAAGACGGMCTFSGVGSRQKSKVFQFIDHLSLVFWSCLV